MRYRIPFAIALLCLFTATALQAAPKTDPVTFPAYDDYKGMARYAPTPEAYAEAMNDKRFVMERITYESDGLQVYAYLYRPAEPKGKMPVIVFNRGSYVRDDFSPEVLMPAHRLAQQGYLVIAPMQRGSGGAAGHDEMGGADLDDIFDILPVLKDLPYADTARLFLYGESRGAIMTMMALRKGFPARAAAVYGLTADFSHLVGKDAPARSMASQIWPDFDKNEAQIEDDRSPVRWPQDINVPVLLMNGADDTSVSPTEAMDMAAALSKLQKPFELKVFYGEKHVLTGRAAERDADVVTWFHRFDTPNP